MSDDISLICGTDAVLPALHSHPAVLVLDSVGRIVAINHSYLRLIGYTRDEVIGRPVWVLLDLAERCAGRLSHLLDLRAGVERHLPELAHVSRSGRRFRVDARVFAIAEPKQGDNLRMVFVRPEEGAEVIRVISFAHRREFPGQGGPSHLISFRAAH